MSEHSQERPSRGLQRLVDICRDVHLDAPHDANPLEVIGDFVDRLTMERVRYSFELLLIHNIAVTLRGQPQDMTPLAASKLFLQAYLARELFADEEVRAKVLAGPHAGVLPAPATT
jgi:hypothetical protein